MALEKAVLVNTATREVIRVQFNPEEYALDAGNNFAEFAVVGLPTPPIQYVRGSGRSLRIELLFDSSGSLGDVRDLTRRVTGLLDKDPRRGAPPPLVFSWGRFDFACVLEKVGQRFTHFRADGVPLRAYLSTTFREFAAATVDVQSGLFGLPPTVMNLVGGETLSGIAGDVLGDPAAWRALAAQNGITNPRTLDGRRDLVVPPPAPR
jgi:hypothetical protein